MYQIYQSVQAADQHNQELWAEAERRQDNRSSERATRARTGEKPSRRSILRLGRLLAK